RWHRAFRSGSPPLHRMILLEAQARLLRLAVEFPPAQRHTHRNRLFPWDRQPAISLTVSSTLDVCAT
ncbi:MAG: hypothetical protein ACK5EA_27800, partial [Planctomycetaceae bacterium]